MSEIKRIRRIVYWFSAIMIALAVLAALPVFIPAAGAVQAQTTYSLNAEPVDQDTMPGVYKVQALPGASAEGETPATIGIPSVSKDVMTEATAASPAIIMGAAVNYEMKTGPTEFTPIDRSAKLVAPYSYFRWQVMDQQTKDADGNVTTVKKLSGFDGSYYIIRVDVSKIIEGHMGEGKYLHVNQEGNKAMMVAVGMEKKGAAEADPAGWTTCATYANGGNKTGSYSLANSAEVMKDAGADDTDKETPYLDIVVLSSSKLAAGADAASVPADPADVTNPDIKLSFYVDDQKEYNQLEVLDPNNMPTFPHEVEDPIAGKLTFKDELEYNAALLKRFFKPEQATTQNRATSYVVKGADLEIDVAIDETETTESSTDSKLKMPINWMTAHAQFWSMDKAIAHPEFDRHTILLICEVPVLEGLSIQGAPDKPRTVILDVNSFDIQIANNDKATSQAGLEIDHDASLLIKDGTNTSGAELAIGNNATMKIKKGGTLIVDETCTNEVEYDAGTVPAGETPPELAIGEITIEDGGKLINNGVINIEGAEAKPKDPSQQDTPVSTDIKRADMFVNYGGVMENNGCISLKGDLYVLGMLNNYGKYNDTIVAKDPDKGSTAYHRGIQVTWKDVVTEPGIEPGTLNVGVDADKKIEKRAVLNNKGDIVLVPGTLNLYGTFNNQGNLYLCTATEAIIPVINPDDPLEVERRVVLDPPKYSVFNKTNGTVNNRGHVGRAKVALLHNGVLGELTPIEDYPVGTAVDVNGDTMKVTRTATDSAPGTVAFIKAKNAKKVTVPATVTLEGKTYQVVVIAAKAFRGKKIRAITIGEYVAGMDKGALSGSRATKLIVKTKKLTRKSVKGSLKGSRVKTVLVKVGKKKVNRKYVKKYRKIFTKKNAGKKVRVKK